MCSIGQLRAGFCRHGDTQLEKAVTSVGTRLKRWRTASERGRADELTGLTASAVLQHVRPRAVGQALPDLGSHDHAVPSADVLDFIIHRQNLHAADLGDERTDGDMKRGWVDGLTDGRWINETGFFLTRVETTPG